MAQQSRNLVGLSANGTTSQATEETLHKQQVQTNLRLQPMG
jgi:hypothetical protein